MTNTFPTFLWHLEEHLCSFVKVYLCCVVKSSIILKRIQRPINSWPTSTGRTAAWDTWVYDALWCYINIITRGHEDEEIFSVSRLQLFASPPNPPIQLTLLNVKFATHCNAVFKVNVLMYSTVVMVADLTHIPHRRDKSGKHHTTDAFSERLLDFLVYGTTLSSCCLVRSDLEG